MDCVGLSSLYLRLLYSYSTDQPVNTCTYATSISQISKDHFFSLRHYSVSHFHDDTVKMVHSH